MVALAAKEKAYLIDLGSRSKCEGKRTPFDMSLSGQTRSRSHLKPRIHNAFVIDPEAILQLSGASSSRLYMLNARQLLELDTAFLEHNFNLRPFSCSKAS